MKITYRKGYPTATAIIKLIEEFENESGIHMSLYYKDSYQFSHAISFSANSNDSIGKLIEFLNSKEIQTSPVVYGKSPSNGNFHIIQKTK